MSVIMHNNNTATKKSNSSASASSAAQFLEVIDPVNRTGKITVPMAYIQETKGMNELTRPKDAKDLSLCLLFQKGRCNAGARCHQIHADASFVEKLRNQANTGASCCALHGDFNSSSYVTSGLTVEVMTNGVATKYSLQSFGRTATMDTMMSSAAGNYSKNIRMNVNKICRLHAQSRCKFGKDCKNVHLCPQAKPIAAPSVPKPAVPAPAAPVAPLSGFARPTEQAAFKSSGPLMGSSTSMTSTSAYLNTTNRKMKSTPGLDVSRSELGQSFGLSTCPTTPNDLAQSTRSVSVESSASHGLSPASAVTPSESPKEKAFGLFNRNVTSSPTPIAESPCHKAESAQIPQPNFNNDFYRSDDSIIGSSDVSVKKATTTSAPALSVNELVAAIWEKPMQTQANTNTASNLSPLAGGDEFEQTMSLLAKDLTAFSCSPRWSQ